MRPSFTDFLQKLHDEISTCTLLSHAGTAHHRARNGADYFCDNGSDCGAKQRKPKGMNHQVGVGGSQGSSQADV